MSTPPIQPSAAGSARREIPARGGDPFVRTLEGLRKLRESPDVEGRYRTAKQFFHLHKEGAVFRNRWRPELTRLKFAPQSEFLGWSTAELIEFLCYELCASSIPLDNYILLEQEILGLLLRGKHDEVRDLLLKVNRLMGPSLWAENLAFFTEEQDKGWRAQKNLFLSRIKPAELDWAIGNFWIQISRKNERSASATVFVSDLKEEYPERGGDVAGYEGLHMRTWLCPWLKPTPGELRAHALVATSMPLIDKYHSVIYLCRALWPEKANRPSSLVECVRYFTRVTGDKRLISLFACLGEEAAVRAVFDAEFLELCDLYTLEKAPLADRLRSYITRHPHAVNAYELWLKAALREGLELPSRKGRPSFLSDIRRRLMIMGGYELPIGDRVSGIHRIVKRSPDATIAAGLYSLLHAAVGRSQQMPEPLDQRLLISPYSPRELGQLGQEGAGAKFLELFASEYPNSPALDVQRYITRPDFTLPATTAAAISPGRQLYYSACREEQQNHSVAALRLYKSAFARKERSPLDQLSSLRGALRVATKLRHNPDALTLAITGFRTNQEFVYALDVGSFLDQASVFDWRELKEEPNVAIVAAFYGLPVRKVYYFVKETLKKFKVSLPSELGPEHMPPETLLLFWERACSMDVLSLLIALRTTKQIEDERILLCEKSAALGNPSPELRRERNRLAYDQVVHSAMDWLHESRLFVDLDAVRQLVAAEVDDAYARMERFWFMSASVAARTKPGAAISGALTELAKECRHFGLREYQRIATALCNAFVCSPSGLDANLGIYFRHGTFKNHLMALLVKHQLTPQTRFGQSIAPAPQEGALEAQLQGFRDYFNKVIEDFRVTKIVATTELTGEPAAVFRIRFEEQMLLETYKRHMEVKASAAVVVEALLAELWRQLTVCAENMKTCELENLQHEIIAQLDKLQQSVQHCAQTPERKSRLNSKLAAFRADLQVEIGETIVRWFSTAPRRPALKHDLRTLCELAARFVRGHHPGTPLNLQTNYRCSGTVSSDYIPPFVETLHILLENAHDHSGYADVGVDVALEVVCSATEVRLTMTNAVNESDGKTAAQAVAKINQKLTADEAEFSVLKDHRGTGLIRARKLIQQDMDRKHARIECVEPDRGLVRIIIIFDREGFLV